MKKYPVTYDPLSPAAVGVATLHQVKYLKRF